jgi:hypothetical protein
MTRKILKIVIIVLVLIALIIGGIYLFSGQKTKTEISTSFKSFLPFGTVNNTPVTPTIDQTKPEEKPVTIGEQKITKTNKLTQVSKFTIAGSFPTQEIKKETILQNDEKDPTRQKNVDINKTITNIRYVQKLTGNIFQTNLDSLEERLISDTTIPKIYESIFAKNGQSVILRYLNENNKIQTFYGDISGVSETAVGGIRGDFLPEDISDLSVSPDGNKIFYLIKLTDKTIGVIYSLKDSKKTQIFSSPFSEWISGWATAKTIILTTKASAFSQGYSYSLNTETKSFNKIIGNIPGLTTLMSPDGKFLLYSKIADKIPKLFLYSLIKKTSFDLGLNTLTEKCIWKNDSSSLFCGIPKSIDQMFYPDDWYQGSVSFSDELWKVDTKTDMPASILIDKLNGYNIDVTKLSISVNENYLFFINKKDSFLWSYKLGE